MPKLGADSFIIHHYAASVTYTVSEFCGKNKDNLAPDMISLIEGSQSAFIKALFEADHAQV